MTPSELLTAAADRLDALLAEATPGPWRLDRYGRSVEAPSRIVVAAVAGRELWPTLGDSAYIAAMNPAVGRVLVALLRQHAHHYELGFRSAEAFALASAILGEAEGGTA